MAMSLWANVDYRKNGEQRDAKVDGGRVGPERRENESEDVELPRTDASELDSVGKYNRVLGLMSLLYSNGP